VPNRLAHESSPYLRQHQDNPVDWYTWGPEALERARAQDKPILLSVGYSACHWCHVMEHESFSDPHTAAEMNAGFVNIKVDREERPDIDDLYMRAVQAFTGGHGGWPMTVFLTPRGEPFFGGTYFPPVPRHGMPSFRQVLAHAQDVYAQVKAGETDIADRVVAAMRDEGDFGAAQTGRSDWLERLVRAAEDSFDRADAGFGGAPKFPPHGTLAVLLAHHAVSGRSRSLRLVTETLRAMARGGLYDHLGGGFARYSVDGQWRIPHFEKMLYDNAQLVPLYVDAHVATGEAVYARIARETLAYLQRDLMHDSGAFYSAEDADSEGEEGRFYVFTPAQLEQILGAQDGGRAADLLQVTAGGSFEHGTSVLRLQDPLEELPEADRDFLVERVLPALREARDQRVRPHRDDKIVTSWNGLAIRAFAHAGRALAAPELVQAAARCARVLLDHALVDGRLHRVLARTEQGLTAKVPAFLDDHANLLNGLLALWEATWDPAWLDAARDLATAALELFDAHDEPALDYVGHDAEALVARSKKLIAGAEPSGNGAMALALTRLSAVTGDAAWGERADRILSTYAPLLDRAPRALGEEALAGHWRHHGGLEIGVIGEPGPERSALLDVLRARLLPFAVTSVHAPDQDPPVSWMAERPALDGAPTAYVCQGFSCRLPVTRAADLTAQLDEVGRSASTQASPPARRSPHVVRAPAWSTEPADWCNTDRPLSLQDLRGHVVVLDFWTFCCINCMHVLPELEAVEAHFEGRPVVVLGVHSAKFDHEKLPQAVQAAIVRHGIRHPVLLDPTHDLWKQYAVRSWPTLVVIDPEGRVAWQKGGEVDRETLISTVEDLLEDSADRGTLTDAPVAWRQPRPTTDTALRHPGKVLVHPGPRAQAEGEVVFGPGSRLFIADTGHHRILECQLTRDPQGWPAATVVRTFGTGQPALVDGSPDVASFREPQGMALLDGEVIVADTGNHALRAIDLETERVRTLAGTGRLGRGAMDPDAPQQTPLRSPWDVEATDGVVFIAMAGTHQIWIWLPEQDRVGPFLGSGREAHIDGAPAEAALAQPSGMQLSGNVLFFADSETSSIRAFEFERKQVGTLLGRGLFDFGDVDGPPSQALLQHPLGVSVTQGMVYVADTYNGKIKQVPLPQAQVSTLAEGLSEPGGLDVAGEYLLVADTNNHRIVAVHRDSGEVRELPIQLAEG